MNGLRLALIVPVLVLGTGCSSNGGDGTGAAGTAGEGATSSGGGSGGASTGGSKTGGTGTGGGSGGSSSSTGGKSTGGGSTGGSSSGGGTCAPFCSKLASINCPNDPDSSACVAGCEAAIDTAADMGPACGAAFESIFVCWGALPASEWACNADGGAEPSVDSCEAEFMAFLDCS